MLKDIAAAQSRNPAVIQALAEVIAFCLVGPFQYHPVTGKKDWQCGQGHAAAAGAIHVLKIFINNSFTYALNHLPLLSPLYRGKLNNISRPISKANCIILALYPKRLYDIHNIRKDGIKRAFL